MIVVCGNDGTGKSTTVAKINEMFAAGKQTEFVAVERSTPLDLSSPIFEKISSIDRKVLDEKTLENTFDRKESDQEDLPTRCNGVPIVYIVLDAPVDELLRRLSTRAARDKWESDKALRYFRQRFLELAAYYGLPVVSSFHGSNTDSTILSVVDVLKAASIYNTYRALALRTLDYEKIQQLDIETALVKFFTENDWQALAPDFPQHWFPHFLADTGLKNQAKIWARHFLHRGVTSIGRDGTVSFGAIKVPPRDDGVPYLQLVVEGESKRVYRIVGHLDGFESLCFIKLKSTIYSHKSQATGEIARLANVRAKGSQILLEMMARNGLAHAYRCVTHSGIALARFVTDIPPTEIVVKRYFVGTDKHLLHGAATQPNIVIPQTGEYVSGPYVRFDWRNPNHVHRETLENPLDSPYYYVVEEAYGKEEFFKRFLQHDSSIFKPVGDTQVTDAVVCNVLECDRARETVLKMFFTTQYYLDFCDPPLVMQDVCYMTDSSGNEIWSEINQDCGRLKTKQSQGSDSFDKDIWRVGGSASKDEILQKWQQFNVIVGKVLRERPFYKTEMLTPNWFAYMPIAQQIFDDSRLKIPQQYQHVYRAMLPQKKEQRRRRRNVIVTIDLHDGKPVLVQRGVVSQVHSDGSIATALQRVSIFPDILMVDLNGAFGEKCDVNRNAICKAAKDYYVHAGGGLRTIADVQEMLQNSVRRIVVGTTTDDQFIAQIPKDRLIVELSVDEKMRVMTHGRAVQTLLLVGDEMLRLSALGVTVISVTFHNTEGMLNGLPRDQICEMIRLLPPTMEKVIIAGGISTLNDVQFLWSLDSRVVPQLGSAIWKDKIDIGKLISSMVCYDQQAQNGVALAPAVVQGKDGRVKGLVWVNDRALQRSATERILYRYSRQAESVCLKGATSGNVQKIYKISVDCDSDAVLITVDDANAFCHNGNDSCFSLQTVIKASLSGLTEYLRRQRGNKSYTAYMQKNPGIAFAKLLEELWEVACSVSKEDQKNEMADLLVHFLMYANGSGVELDDLLNELNARRHDPHLTKLVVSTSSQRTIGSNIVTIAIAADKYCDKTDTYICENLGIVVERPPKGSRSCKLVGKIVDMQKFHNVFGTLYDKVAFVGSRPKDMSFLLSRGRVDACVTYNATMLNFPSVSLPPVAEKVVDNLSLCLVARKGDWIAKHSSLWTRTNKCLIAAEHVMSVSDYLQHRGIDMSSVTLDRVLGSSEGFLVNESNRHYSLCDAIVETGETLAANDLEVAFVVLEKVKLGLYCAIKRNE